MELFSPKGYGVDFFAHVEFRVENLYYFKKIFGCG